MEKATTSLSVVLTDGSHLPIFVKHLESDLIRLFDETIVVSLCGNENPFLKPIEDSCSLINVNPKDFPSLFYTDSPSSFSSEKFNWSGPYSGQKKIVNWSKVRNLGFSRCSQEFRIVVFEDEIVSCPEKIHSLIELMKQKNSEVAYTKRTSGCTDGYVPRVTRNEPGIKWFGSADETIDGITRYLASDEHLKSKVFSALGNHFERLASMYANSLIENWNVYPRDLINLARYSVPFFGIETAKSILSDYLNLSLHTEERAWACAVGGEIMEKTGHVEEAVVWYRRSMDEHPGWKSAMRLCRVLFHQQKFSDVLDVYSEGVQCSNEHHLIDNGNESIEKTLVLIAECNHRLGNKEEARDNCQVLRSLFPKNEKINHFCGVIER